MSRRWALVAFGVLSAACAVTVRTDFNERVDFTQYRSFRVAACQSPGTACSAEGNLLEDRIAGAVSDQLRARGLQPEADRPDLLVAFTVMTFTKGDLVQPTGVPPWGGMGGDIWTDDLRAGTLVLAVRDARTNCTVWTARVQSARQDFASSPVIQQTVAKALEGYPPGRRGPAR
jgi:hypothetical protein